ncbi:hypothetical protein SPI_06546 [Niveomyces insectorum RCEF 264]|uniref:ML-like domain-containing protein n=1 Tax=Niveomyces insectorum RCEF 264 TaxID=1081102 RepID=A0A167RCW5_9HYPO|nr:hypothetical protein SPI_06546 [Niveomyces insectorum RCEF 264]
MRPPSALLAATAAVVGVGAQNVLRSTSLNECQKNSQFTASLLNIFYTPQNNSAYVHLIGVSSIEGYAVFDITITVYGYDFLHKTIDPCQINLPGLCPMTAAKTDSPPFNVPVSTDAEQQIPNIAYTFPDLDAKVRVYINMTTGDQAGHAAACLELDVSNGKTVDLVGVQWASACVILAALLASTAIGQLGHFNAAAHVAVHALALFGYFQAQAIIGLCGMPLPPIVQAWTQDFQWSLGLIKLGFMQNVLTWYQRATGGTPSLLFDSLSDVSVAVQRRSLSSSSSVVSGAAPLAPSALARRGVVRNGAGSFVVFGIQRAAFRAGIDPSNAFLTVIGFFTALVVGAVLCVLFAKAAVELAVHARWIDGRRERTLEFRNGWRTILKGVIFRCMLAGFPAVAIYCLWEFTQADSAAEVVNAVVYLLTVATAMAYGAYTVIRLASRSIGLHRNPAYILFSDPRTLNKWGCFYVQFRASGYYFAVPVLAHTFLKACFIAFAQRSGTTQAIGLIIIEAGALIGATVLRPWMDKSTNSFNITICVVNFLNAIILLIFSNVFNQPPLGTGVVGLVFWVLNAAVTLILLLMIIVTTIVIFFRNNPDARYQYMADDRTSFVKSQVQLASNELDALALTARGVANDTSYGGSGSLVDGKGRGRHGLPGGNGNGKGQRDRLLMLDDPDDTDSFVSESRHATPLSQLRRSGGIYGRKPSPAPLAVAGARAATLSAAAAGGTDEIVGPLPAPESRSASRNTYRDRHNDILLSNNNNNNNSRHDDNILPRSPATPSVPMLPVDERQQLRTGGGGGPGYADGGLRSPGSPAYGFGGSRSNPALRNTPPLPSMQPSSPSPSSPSLTPPQPPLPRFLGSTANAAARSTSSLPTAQYRQLHSNSPEATRSQHSGR